MNNFTQIPNDVLESIYTSNLNATQLKILLLLWRYTYGYHRTNFMLSVSLAAKILGISEQSCMRQLKQLIEMGIVLVDGHEPIRNTRLLRFNPSALTAPFSTSVVSENDILKVSCIPKTSDENTNKKILDKILSESEAIDEKTYALLTRWLEYKSERGENYTKASMRTLLELMKKYVSCCGCAAVEEAVSESIAAGYKAIIWDKLKSVKEEKSMLAFTESKYSYDELELLSRAQP